MVIPIQRQASREGRLVKRPLSRADQLHILSFATEHYDCEWRVHMATCSSYTQRLSMYERSLIRRAIVSCMSKIPGTSGTPCQIDGEYPSVGRGGTSSTTALTSQGTKTLLSSRSKRFVFDFGRSHKDVRMNSNGDFAQRTRCPPLLPELSLEAHSSMLPALVKLICKHSLYQCHQSNLWLPKLIFV